jgi:hypothetical protein
VLALDYHRVARKPSGKPPERPLLTPTGREVVAAKYHNPGGTADEVTLGERLAAIVEDHPAYAGASQVAAVPGSHHDFSGDLGKDVAKRTNKAFVLLEARAGSSKADPRFTVVDPARLENTTIVLVDDVYRQGRTLQAAAAALLDEGADEVLGLTATCTISGAAAPCLHDSHTEGDLDTQSAPTGVRTART